MPQTAIGFEYLQRAIDAAQQGTSYCPVITIGQQQFSFYTPSLGDVELVTKTLFSQGALITSDGTANLQVLSNSLSLFAEIHMKMELRDGAAAPRAVQKADLERLPNPAHVLLFKNVYLSLCLFFILKSEGYTITF